MGNSRVFKINRKIDGKKKRPFHFTFGKENKFPDSRLEVSSIIGSESAREPSQTLPNGLFTDVGLQEEVSRRFARVPSPKVKKILKGIVLDAKRSIYRQSLEKKLQIVDEVKEMRPLKSLAESSKKKSKAVPNPVEELSQCYFKFLKQKVKEQSIQTQPNPLTSGRTFGPTETTRDEYDPGRTSQKWGYNSTAKKVTENLSMFNFNSHIEKNKKLVGSKKELSFSQRSIPNLENKLRSSKMLSSSLGKSIRQGIESMEILQKTPEYKMRVNEVARLISKGAREE